MIYILIYRFYQKKTKINGHNKIVCMQYDTKHYVAHIRNIKQALKHGLKLKQAHKVIAF